MAATSATLLIPMPFDSEPVQRAVRHLTARQRAALCLRLGQGLSEREVAAVLSCRVSTVHRLVARGLRRVRAELVTQGAFEDHIVTGSGGAAQAARMVAR